MQQSEIKEALEKLANQYLTRFIDVLQIHPLTISCRIQVTPDVIMEMRNSWDLFGIHFMCGTVWFTRVMDQKADSEKIWQSDANFNRHYKLQYIDLLRELLTE